MTAASGYVDVSVCALSDEPLFLRRCFMKGDPSFFSATLLWLIADSIMNFANDLSLASTVAASPCAMRSARLQSRGPPLLDREHQVLTDIAIRLVAPQPSSTKRTPRPREARVRGASPNSIHFLWARPRLTGWLASWPPSATSRKVLRHGADVSSRQADLKGYRGTFAGFALMLFRQARLQWRGFGAD